MSLVEYRRHSYIQKKSAQEDINEPSYRAELIQKYGLSQYDGLGYKHYKEKGGPDSIALTAWKDGKEVILDKNFEFKMVEKTVTAAILSDNTIYEMQHIDPTEDASMNSIYTTEKVFNKLFESNDIRVVEVISTA